MLNISYILQGTHEQWFTRQTDRLSDTHWMIDCTWATSFEDTGEVTFNNIISHFYLNNIWCFYITVMSAFHFIPCFIPCVML
jgi:hypothetical protein